MLPGWFGDDESPPRPAAPEGEPMMSITLAAGARADVGPVGRYLYEPDGAAIRAHYLRRWTTWNHVRTATSLLAAASFIMALRCSPRRRTGGLRA